MNRATVAKWGFVIDVDANHMFTSTYGNARDALVISDDNGVSVASEYSSIFPGTDGSLEFSISGTAEVAARTSFVIPDDIEIVCLKNEVGEIVYTPILWTLIKNGETVLMQGDLTALKEALAGAVVNPNVEVNESYVLKWEWPL